MSRCYGCGTALAPDAFGLCPACRAALRRAAIQRELAEIASAARWRRWLLDGGEPTR